MLLLAWRKDRRESGAPRAPVPDPVPALLPAPSPDPAETAELQRWALVVSDSPTEWRLAQLSRRYEFGAPRVWLGAVSLVAPPGARIAPGDPASPGAAFGLFHRPALDDAGARIVFNGEMPDATDFESTPPPFPGYPYARVQFFVAPPAREPDEATAPLIVEFDAEHAAGARARFRLKLHGNPMA